MVFKRKIFKHITEAANVHHSGKKAHITINSTGLSAGKLDGVNDVKMMPARGQTVLVRNEADVMCSASATDDGDDEVCYTMQRAAGENFSRPNPIRTYSYPAQVVVHCLVAVIRKVIGTRRSIQTWRSGS